MPLRHRRRTHRDCKRTVKMATTPWGRPAWSIASTWLSLRCRHAVTDGRWRGHIAGDRRAPRVPFQRL